MYENVTVLTNKEYADLIIKAHKYDLLRKRAVESTYLMPEEETVFELTAREKAAMEERRKQA